MRRVMLMSLMCVALLACLSPVLTAQDTPSAFAGNWTGSVKANVGEMPIEATFKVDGDKITGEIRTFHGGFKIEKSAREKDGRWKLSFRHARWSGGQPHGRGQGRRAQRRLGLPSERDRHVRTQTREMRLAPCCVAGAGGRDREAGVS